MWLQPAILKSPQIFPPPPAISCWMLTMARSRRVVLLALKSAVPGWMSPPVVAISPLKAAVGIKRGEKANTASRCLRVPRFRREMMGALLLAQSRSPEPAGPVQMSSTMVSRLQAPTPLLPPLAGRLPSQAPAVVRALLLAPTMASM